MRDWSDRVEEIVSSPLFPFGGCRDVKPLSARKTLETPREAEGSSCRACGRGDSVDVLWQSPSWRVVTAPPMAVPVLLMLEAVRHVDFVDLCEAEAAELGRIEVKLARAIEDRKEVGRAHVHRWGDGASHAHLWFVGRPLGQDEFRGWGAMMWAQVLPPVEAEALKAANREVVAEFRSAWNRPVGDA